MVKTKIHQIKLTKAQFDFLNTSDNWEIVDIPKQYWSLIPGIARLQDTFAMMGSASPNHLVQMHDLYNIGAGIDLLTVERNPKPNEPQGNAYHFVFQITLDPQYPITMYGPYMSDMAVPHWFSTDDLDVYKDKKE